MLTLAVSIALAAPAPKVSLCHQDETGGYALISVSANAAAAHLTNHADVYTGAYFPDVDGDGYGDPYGGASACPAPGYTLDASDCDDADAATNPGAEEVCGDEIDNNCDLQIDEGCEVSCPGDAYDFWTSALEEGTPGNNCMTFDSEFAADVILPGDATWWDVGAFGCFGNECFLSDDFTGWTRQTFYVGSVAEREACWSEIEAWLDSHGASCTSW